MILRKESLMDQVLIDRLREIASNMLTKLYSEDILLNSKDVHIWIKEKGGNKYLKVEFAYKNEELQYDLPEDGSYIQETHFKSFVQDGPYRGDLTNVRRVDLSKENACTFLQRIDDVIKGV